MARRLRMARRRRTVTLIAAVGALLVAAAAIIVTVGLQPKAPADKPGPAAPHSAALPHKPGAYLGVYTARVPNSYVGVTAFAAATGVQPNIALYYSGWGEPFQTAFALSAASHGAAPLVQIDPTGVRLAPIASGRYDDFLRSYAHQVASYGRPVIIGFGHEMNGWWYSWGYGHTSPAVFVAAWRHVVDVFRQQGARNVTWLWTVNVFNKRRGTPAPARWWPGSSYVNWIGIDGYYMQPSWTFAPLFGPTIKAVRALSRAPIPILISETGATPLAGKPAKITDLFAGVRAYGLLGLVWFDANRARDWSLSSPAAIAAFRRGARDLGKTAP